MVNLPPQDNVISFLAGIITGLFAGWVRHRFSLYRDKRKEFNIIADRIFLTLDAEENSLMPGKYDLGRDEPSRYPSTDRLRYLSSGAGLKSFINRW